MTPDVFDALANPLRRQLLDRLRGGPLPVNTLVAGLGRGRPALSEHLALLRAAGLVVAERHGREQHYHLNAAPLREAVDWLAAYEQFWAGRLTTLAAVLAEPEPE